MYSKLCYRIKFIQEPFGACVCTVVSSWHTVCSHTCHSLYTCLIITHVNTALTKS